MILLTGASGIVGTAIATRLNRERPLRIGVRPGNEPCRAVGVKDGFRGELSIEQDWGGGGDK